MASRQPYARHEAGRVILGFPYEPELIADIKAEIPAWAREWEPIGKEWIVRAPYTARAADLLRRYFAHARVTGEPSDDSEWDESETRRSRRESWRDDRREGWSYRASPPPPGGGDPYATLHLLPTAPPQLVKAAYLTLVKLCHPDVARDLDREEAHRRTVALTAAYRSLQERGVAT